MTQRYKLLMQCIDVIYQGIKLQLHVSLDLVIKISENSLLD